MRTILKIEPKMGRVSGIDSGNETEEGSPDLPSTSTTPHNFSDRINQDKVVIRPVAFKPTGLPKGNNSLRYGSTPSLARPGSILTLYGSSNDLRQRRNYSLDRKRGCSPMTMSSLPLTTDSGHRSLGYESLDSIYTPTPTSMAKDNYRLGRAELGLPRVASVCGSEAVKDAESELELALKERDSELQYLRQTMEHNEAAIIRVYQDKERAWERELRRMKELHEARLHKATTKALRLEQMLIMHTYQLQQDKKRLREELEKSEQENMELRKEVDQLRVRLDETEWGICQKSGEISLLKSQLKDLQNDQGTKCQEITAIKSEVKDLKILCEKKETELQQLASELNKKDKQVKELEIDNLKLTVDELNKIPDKEYTEELIKGPETLLEGVTECDEMKEKLQKLEEMLKVERSEWQAERQRWAQEKEKVIKYQRQLQINYVQMYKRTQYLETELDRARAENSEEKLASISSVSIHL